ncbi:MAG: METTL5 family protein, partial [Candidatus Nanohalobium sp.]
MDSSEESKDGKTVLMKAELKKKLSQAEGFENPRISLEQYVTPPGLAADMVHTAYMQGDIEGLTVADLGTGTGVLAIGAALAGAEKVKAFDKDEEALEKAEENAERLGVKKFIDFEVCDVEEVEEDVDTVLMNPPFSVHSDIGLSFWDRAVEIGEKVYGICPRGAREPIKDFVGNSSHEILGVEAYSIGLPPSY